MPKLNVLSMVQDILSDMDSDNVNSISDTIEALQVAQIVKTTYYELLNNRTWPHTGDLIQLEASGDSDKPTHMKVPEDVSSISWVKYDKRKTAGAKKEYVSVTKVSKEEFLDLVFSRDSTASNIVSVTDYSGAEIFVRNDMAPTYYTSFDDEYVVFDSYNATLDTTLQSSKIVVFGFTEPTFTLEDTFVPDMPIDAFPLLLAESKSVAFNTIKQAANQKAEQQSDRQRRFLTLNRGKVESGGFNYPNYGRK